MGRVNVRIVCPLVVLTAGGINTLIVEKSNANAESNYLKYGAWVEEALNGIKIVKAFGQEEYEVTKYERHLKQDEKNHYSHAIGYGLSMGFLEWALILLMTYTWFMGGIFIAERINNCNFDRDYGPGDMLGAHFWIQMGASYLAYSFLNIQALKRGVDATRDIFKVIDTIFY